MTISRGRTEAARYGVVTGSRLAAEHVDSHAHRHDLYYIENWSLMLDVKILFMTVLHGLKHENAY